MPEQEIIINNFKIKYAEQYNLAGPVFVFLHGWGSNYKSFVNIYKDLDNYFLFDFPGFGDSSDLTKPLSLVDYADLTFELINKKIKDREIIFVAHSFGGRVLLKLLNNYNIKNIKQIICIGVPFVRENKSRNKKASLITGVLKKMSFILPENTRQKVRKKWCQAIGASDYADLESEVIKKTFQNIIGEDVVRLTSNLKQYKTDFIWGENDQEAPINGVQQMATMVNVKLHVIRNSGHFPFVGKTANEFKNIFEQIIKI